MYTINIRGKQNPKDTKMVKLEMIFFKTGYARVPKVINITGLLKDWDVKSQSFRVGSAEATTKNKLLFDLRTKYLLDALYFDLGFCRLDFIEAM